MTHFGDTVRIETEITKYNGIKLELAYVVKDSKTDEVRCLGKSSHCFLDRQGHPISLKRDWKAYHEHFLAAVKKEEL